MKYAIEAIRILHPNWEGAVHFNDDGTIKEIMPNDGHPQVDSLQLVDIHADIVKKQIVLKRIADAESQITPRRLREAMLGLDGGWLATQNNTINTLRDLL